MLAYKDARRVRLISLNGVDHGEQLRELAAAITELKANVVVLDGEVAIFDAKLVGLVCPQCGGRLRLIATLHDPAVIRKLLAHLGMARSGPAPGPAPSELGAAAP